MLAQERFFFPIMHVLCTGLESISVYLHVLYTYPSTFLVHASSVLPFINHVLLIVLLYP